MAKTHGPPRANLDKAVWRLVCVGLALLGTLKLFPLSPGPYHPENTYTKEPASSAKLGACGSFSGGLDGKGLLLTHLPTYPPARETDPPIHLPEHAIEATCAASAKRMGCSRFDFVKDDTTYPGACRCCSNGFFDQRHATNWATDPRKVYASRLRNVERGLHEATRRLEMLKGRIERGVIDCTRKYVYCDHRLQLLQEDISEKKEGLARFKLREPVGNSDVTLTKSPPPFGMFTLWLDWKGTDFDDQILAVSLGSLGYWTSWERSLGVLVKLHVEETGLHAGRFVPLFDPVQVKDNLMLVTENNLMLCVLGAPLLVALACFVRSIARSAAVDTDDEWVPVVKAGTPYENPTLYGRTRVDEMRRRAVALATAV